MHFPQFEGKALPEIALCLFCTEDNEYATVKARDQHLKVMHKEEQAQMRMGQQIGEQLKLLLAQMGAQQDPFLCGLRQEALSSASDLTLHVMLHQEAGDRPTSPTPALAADSKGRK